MSKFVIRTVSSGVKFDLRAANGQSIADYEGHPNRPEENNVPGAERINNI